MLWHPALEKRWNQLPVYQQILMICNELNRAANLEQDPKEYKNALERALELMDFSIDDSRTRPCMKEFLRARELVAMQYAGHESSPLPDIMRGLIQLNSDAWAYAGKPE